MKGLFIESNYYGGVLLDSKKNEKFYFVKIESDITEDKSEDNYEYSYQEELLARQQGLHRSYVKCFTCNAEHFLFINENNVKEDIFSEFFTSKADKRYFLNKPYIKKLIKTNGDEVLNELETDKVLEVSNTTISCPCCGENNIHFASHPSANLLLNENEKYFHIKFYSHNYSHSYKVDGKTVLTKMTERNYDENPTEKKIVSIPFSYQIIFNKEKNNVYIRFKNKIIQADENKLLLRMPDLSDILYLDFLKDILYFYENKLNEYQKKSMDFSTKINDLNSVVDFVFLFKLLKQHLTYPFLFEFLGENSLSVYNIHFSKYRLNKIKQAKSGKEIIEMMFKKTNKKTKKLLVENNHKLLYSGTYDKDYSTIFNLLTTHDNVGLNQLVLEKIISLDGYYSISKENHYKLLKKYLSVDNIFNLFLDTKNPEEYNRLLRDSIFILKKIDELITSPTELEKRKKSIMAAKKSLKEIQEKKTLSLNRIHDKLSFIHDEIVSVFEEFDYSKKEMELNFKKDDISILLYKNSIELKESAKRLKNCAYSYTGRVKNKELILFELKQDKKEKMCIEVKGNKIVQAKLSSNQVIDNSTPIDIKNTLKEWIAKNNLEIQTSDLYNL